MPPKALEKTGLVPLGVGQIGQTVAWRYEPAVSCLAIETSRGGLNKSRFLAYIRAVCECQGYGAIHVMTEASIEALRQGRVRQVSVQLATPNDLQAVAAYQQTVAQGMGALMSESLGTMLEVRYSLRVGEPDMPISKIERLINWFRGEHDAERGNIAKLQARVIDEEGKSDDIDMLDVHLEEQRDLTLPDDDPDHSYAVRKAFLQTAFSKHMPTLLAQFAP